MRCMPEGKTLDAVDAVELHLLLELQKYISVDAEEF